MIKIRAKNDYLVIKNDFCFGEFFIFGVNY